MVFKPIPSSGAEFTDQVATLVDDVEVLQTAAKDALNEFK